jgi:hypothetical protein
VTLSRNNWRPPSKASNNYNSYKSLPHPTPTLWLKNERNPSKIHYHVHVIFYFIFKLSIMDRLFIIKMRREM